MKDQEKGLEPGLYMVATPIGNLEDITYRALRVLKNADWVAAEDTRITSRLFQHYGIESKLISFHEHSDPAKARALVQELLDGKTGAYVSDAGTPGICDPGAALVRAADDLGVRVVPVPGPSALTALLSVSGVGESAFVFHGFFPREKSEREEWLAEALASGGAHVFFESPHRIHDCLGLLKAHMPDARLIVGREISKRFETVQRARAADFSLEADLTEKGEFVVAIELPSRDSAQVDREAVAEILRELKDLGAGQKILTRVAISHGLAKNEAYALALATLQR